MCKKFLLSSPRIFPLSYRMCMTSLDTSTMSREVGGEVWDASVGGGRKRREWRKNWRRGCLRHFLSWNRSTEMMESESVKSRLNEQQTFWYMYILFCFLFLCTQFFFICLEYIACVYVYFLFSVCIYSLCVCFLFCRCISVCVFVVFIYVDIYILLLFSHLFVKCFRDFSLRCDIITDQPTSLWDLSYSAFHLYVSYAG